MIRNVAVMRLKAGVSQEKVDALTETLLGMRIKGMLSLSAGRDLGLREGNLDYVVVSDFEDEAAYRVYDEDPEHNRIRRELVAPIVERVERVQYVVGTIRTAHPPAHRTSLRRKLIQKSRADFGRLRSALGQLPAEADVGGWTARDVAIHVAAWDRELVRGLDQLLAGSRPDFVGYDENEFNSAAVRRTASRPPAGVMSELDAAHNHLLSRLDALSDVQWERRSRHAWPSGQPMTVGSLFTYTYKRSTHYGGHAAELEATGGSG